MTSYIRNKYELDSFQIDAFKYIDSGYNVVVSAPTGSGKTTIADYAIEQAKQLNPKAKIIYTCPIKALCNEKYRDMTMSWGSHPYNYVIGLMTGDITINPYGEDVKQTEQMEQIEQTEQIEQIKQTKANSQNSTNIICGDIVVMTTEVLQKLMENEGKNQINPSVIIFDEAHYIDDEERGHVWEKCIIGSLIQTNSMLILLSATIGNVPEIMHWLNSICSDYDNINSICACDQNLTHISKSKEFKSVIKTERPVPLRQFVLDNTKSRIFKKITAETDDDIRKVSSDPDPESYELLELTGSNYDRAKKYWERLEQFGYTEQFEFETNCNQIASDPRLGIPAIVFVLSKKQCEMLAQSIVSSYVNSDERNEILKYYDANLREFETCSQYIELRKIIQKGIGYHHSGLIPKIREVVEFLIKDKLIKIVFATETFAVGLNFPVKTAIITRITKPTEKGFRFLTPSEYKQMAGRAGRRFDPFGNVILMLFNTKSKAKNPYPSWAEVNSVVNGSVNNVYSRFIIEPNYILKNITSGSYKQIGLKSFKYYRSEIKKRDLVCPDKFVKLFEIDKKIREFAKNNISFKDKNYSKLYSKLSLEEQNTYKNFLAQYDNNTIKTDLELHFELEEEIANFLIEKDFVKRIADVENKPDKSNYVLTSKGYLACEFTEINPIIFMDNIEHIMSISTNIIPTLSMFIDDGIKIQDDEIIHWEQIEPEIVYWENAINSYSKFIKIYPKWNYYPKNYLAIKEWLDNPDMNLDQIGCSYQIDLGLFVKILLKLYQVSNELVERLDKLNMADLTEKLVKQKELLIRPPLKIDSLYINM